MSNKSKVILKDYVEVKGKKYYVDNKRVVLEPTNSEIRMAKWLSNILSKQIELLPRVKLPKNIKTADYLIDGELWDLKSITSNRNDAIRSRIRNQETQSSNFIIDITKSKIILKAAEKQIKHIKDITG